MLLKKDFLLAMQYANKICKEETRLMVKPSECIVDNQSCVCLNVYDERGTYLSYVSGIAYSLKDMKERLDRNMNTIKQKLIK